jgi:membrane protease YdiL (CAAX protease family)
LLSGQVIDSFSPKIWLTPLFLIAKVSFKNLGFTVKNISKNILLGLSVGLILSLERILLNHPHFEFSFAYIITSLFTAVTEETLFRGYLLNTWLRKSKNPIIPMLLNGLLFTSFHLPLAIFQLQYTGYNLFTYLSVNFVSGLIDIYLFYQTRSIATSVANHFVWNTFSGIFR